MVLSAFFALAIVLKFSDNRKRQVLSAALTVSVLYFVYIAFVVILHGINKVPFHFPIDHAAIIIVGLLSLIGGFSALVLLLRKIRFRKIASLVVIPFLVLLFMSGFLFEAGLFTPAKIDSFDYVADIDPRILDENFEGEFYYDEERNVIVFDGKEHEPKEVDNPDHFSGLSRVGAFLFEALNPYAGNALPVVQEEFESDIGIPVLLLYALKSFFWIFLSTFGLKTRS